MKLAFSHSLFPRLQASGIKTEFWEFPGQDFGADLEQWTGNLTANDDVRHCFSWNFHCLFTPSTASSSRLS